MKSFKLTLMGLALGIVLGGIAHADPGEFTDEGASSPILCGNPDEPACPLPMPSPDDYGDY